MMREIQHEAVAITETSLPADSHRINLPFLLSFSACAANSPSLLFVLMITTTAFPKEKYQRPGPIHLTHDGEKWAEKTLHKLTLEEKVGQVFMIWCRASFLNVENPEYLQLREAMQKYHVGSFAMTVHVDGPYLLRSEPYEAAELLNRLQSDSKLPLLFAADFERGVSMRLMGTTVFPHAMAFGGDGKLEDAETFGRITAEESRAIGIHWNFFPDARRELEPSQSHHQHALIRRRSQASGRSGRGLYQGRA